MAVYGLGTTPGQVPWTGYSNTLGSPNANQDATTGYVQFNGISQGDDRIAKMLRNGGGTRLMQAVWNALTGAVAGSNATATYRRVQGTTGSQGGLQTIETVSVVNRNTTAADRTAFLALLARTPTPSSYPADLSGNGGGGKVQY